MESITTSTQHFQASQASSSMYYCEMGEDSAISRAGFDTTTFTAHSTRGVGATIYSIDCMAELH